MNKVRDPGSLSSSPPVIGAPKPTAMRLLSALLFSLSSLPTLAQPQICEGLNAGFSFVPSGGGYQFSNTTTGTGTTTTWLWVFDDGTTSDNPQPFHTFPVAGIYEVCLKALSTYTDDNGATITCSDTYCANVTWQGGDPCAGFQACFVTNDFGDGEFFFDNCSSQGGNAQYVWNFGDGTTSTGVNVEHVYQQPGTYTVCLTAYWQNCVDSTCTTVVVEGGGDPCAGFDANISWSPSGNNTITFVGTTTPPAVTMLWYFGDGTQGFGMNPTHTYTAPGQYHACLVAWYWNDQIQDSCFTEACTWVTVGTTNPCDSLSANFWWQGGGPSGIVSYFTIWEDGVSWLWSFGDGTFSDDGHQGVHTYAEPGVYQLCLTVTALIPGTQDTCSTTSCQWVTISEGDPCEGFDATINWSPAGNNTIAFAGTTTVPGAGITWYFGDGTLGYEPNVTHAYTAPGKYHACLVAWYWNDLLQDSCITEACVWVTVGVASPCDSLSANFSLQGGGTPGSIFYSAASGVGPHWLWSFGDGTFSDNGPQGVHTYAEPGLYQVCLTVFAYIPGTQDTCSVTSCQWITIYGPDPCEGFDAAMTWSAGDNNSATFAGTTTLPAISMVWYFGDGTSAPGSTATHTYAEPGEYYVCFEAWYWNQQLQDSCVTEDCHWITVGDDPCAGFEACFVTNDLGDGVFFFDNCTGQNDAQFVWDFGDGTTSTVVNVEHVYQQPGTYTVCLTAYWQDCVDSTCTTIVVEGGGDPCDGFVATITWNPSGNNSATFVGTTSSSAAGMIWYFGDGTQGFGQTATHTYSAPGQYHVCLAAWYWNQQLQDSCWTETCVWITVGTGDPCDGLNANFTTTVAGVLTNFQNAVVNPQWSYHWTFGDGSTGDGPNPSHIYSGPGMYNVCLTVWSWDPVEQDTCFADHCMWLTIGGDPCDTLEACFQVDQINATVFEFLNCTQPQTGVQFVWHFGDGSTSTNASLTHVYQEPGVYTVCLIAYWQDCTDSTCTTLTVGSGTPCDNDFETDFTWTAQGTAVIFQGTSNLPANLLWFFGDGTIGNGAVVTHLYEPPGPYNVCFAAWYWNPQTQDTCWAEHCELIDPFDPTNGIADADLVGVRIYPQPATDVLTIEGLEAMALLRLFGSDGRMVLQERAQGSVHHLDVSDLATGVYVLRLDIDGRSARYRIAVE